MMKKKLIIFGIGPLAKMINFFFSRDSEYDIVAFTVDSEYIKEKTFLDKQVIEFDKIENQYSINNYEMFIAIGPSGMNKVREKKFKDAKKKGYKLASYISTKAICDSLTGENVFIGDMSVINPFVDLGNNILIWENSVINNNVSIEDHCYISPHSSIGTNSIIKQNSIIGTGAIIKTGINIAEKTLIGAGCYISQDTKAKGVYGVKSSGFYGSISEKIDIAI